MKKLSVFLFVQILVLCLCSCITPTLVGPSNNEQPIEEKNVYETPQTSGVVNDTTPKETTEKVVVEEKEQDNSKNVYSSYSYSSKLTSDEITKEDKVIVFVSITDFKWKRSLEGKIKERFTERGIDSFIVSDYLDTENISSSDYWTYMYNQPFVSDDDYPVSLYLEVMYEELYTYEYGGGIGSVEFSVLLWDLFSDTIIEKMIIDVDGEKNNMESFNSSMTSVVDLLSTEIVNEYCKYLTH